MKFPFIGRSRHEEEPRYDLLSTILPESVRYALQYNEAKLGKEEVFALLHCPYYEKLGVYLALKLIAKHQTPRDFFVAMTPHITNTQRMVSWCQQRLTDLPDALTHGMKCRQYSHYGPETFDQGFSRLAGQFVNSDHMPMLVAYAGTLGLVDFAQHTPLGHSFGIIVPATSETQLPGIVCYTSTAPGFEADWVQPSDVGKIPVFVDDVVHTGVTKDTILHQWIRSGGRDGALFQSVLKTFSD